MPLTNGKKSKTQKKTQKKRKKRMKRKRGEKRKRRKLRRRKRGRNGGGLFRFLGERKRRIVMMMRRTQRIGTYSIIHRSKYEGYEGSNLKNTYNGHVR